MRYLTTFLLCCVVSGCEPAPPPPLSIPDELLEVPTVEPREVNSLEDLGVLVVDQAQLIDRLTGQLVAIGDIVRGIVTDGYDAKQK